MAEYEFTKRDASLGITWAKLHQEICCNPELCKLPMRQEEFMDKMFSRTSDDESDTAAKGKLYIAAFTPKGDTASASRKKYIGWMYHAKDGIHSRFNNVRDYIIGQKTPSGEDWDYKTHPDIIAFKTIWEELIPVSGPECNFNETLENAIDELLLEIPSNPLQIMERLSALNASHEYSLTLAILAVIASTLFCFGCGEINTEENDHALQNLILPPMPRREESSELQKARAFVTAKDVTIEKLTKMLALPLKNPLEKGEAYYLLARCAYDRKDQKKFQYYLNESVKYGNKKALRLRNEGKAIELLVKARSIYNSPDQDSMTSIKECCENCQKILHLSPSVDDKYRGEASYILYKYIKIGLYNSPSGETAQVYLDESHRCGYPLAKDDWKASNNFSIKPQFERSSDITKGICYTNANNIYSRTFAKTIPYSWNAGLEQFNLKSVEKNVYDDTHCRFLFVDDDPHKNLQDFFALLQLIKEAAPESLDHYEIFLRHKYDIAKPLVDTALNHLTDYQIAVYILDDDKQAAQQLLSFHPLFYPVKSVNFNSPLIQSGQEKPILNFIVLGNTNVAEWLVREAFWMMGFKDNLIENRITILASDGIQFDAKIKSQYPGMVKGNLCLNGIDFPEIRGVNVDFSSPDLSNEIAKILESSRYNYFTVAAASDEENLALAMRIREILIRNSISEGKDRELTISSPVAFLCRNDDLSWISKKMVVEQEDEGDRWFNTWALIPFGEISRHYSWDTITGGTFEQLARCIHYQYCNVTPEDALNKTDNWKRYTKDYYLRQYNQDSSYSSALSMPYRIFQFQDSDHNQITPAAWIITQPTVFSSVSHIKELSNRFNRYQSSEKKAEEEQKIGEWEHARWVKWMLSRGWMPATIQEVILAHKNGNPRQQLFVAKLHPCLCSYEDLKALENALWINCKIRKDFYTNDLSNIRDTQKLLALEWIHTASKENDAYDTPR